MPLVPTKLTEHGERSGLRLFDGSAFEELAELFFRVETDGHAALAVRDGDGELAAGSYFTPTLVNRDARYRAARRSSQVRISIPMLAADSVDR